MRFALLGIGSLLGSLLVLAGRPAAGGLAGRLCFVRGEDMGVTSTHPVRILGEHEGRSRKLVELRGRGKPCVSVPPGKWSLEARSTRPDDPKASDPDQCRSFPLVVEVTKSEPVTITVSPLGGGATSFCGWDLR
jgi:hypothetical protein